MVKPVRICPASKSIEPIVQASVNILISDGLKAGVRARFLISTCPGCASSSAVSRDLSISKCLTIAAKSPFELDSSSLLRKCSISMS